MIVRGGEGTLLFGTGFSEIFSSGKTYKSFPDMRLPYSEKDRLIGWVLLTPEFDIEVFVITSYSIHYTKLYEMLAVASTVCSVEIS